MQTRIRKCEKNRKRVSRVAIWTTSSGIVYITDKFVYVPSLLPKYIGKRSK